MSPFKTHFRTKHIDEAASHFESFEWDQAIQPFMSRSRKNNLCKNDERKNFPADHILCLLNWIGGEILYIPVHPRLSDGVIPLFK